MILACKKLAIVNFICSLFYLVGLANAQSLKATPTPQAKKIVSDKLMLLELEMAESSYALNADLKNKTRLLTIYERIVYTRCMYEMHRTLIYTGLSTDPVCREYIDKIFQLDAGNVVGYCAKEGIDSEKCRHASLNQATATYNIKDEEKKGTASVDDIVALKKDAPKIRDESINLLNRIRTLENSKQKKNNFQERKTAMQRILQLNCNRTRINISGEDKNTVQATPTALSLVPSDLAEDTSASPTPDKTDPISQLLRENFAKPTPSVVLDKSYRVYEIPIECDEYIKQAFKIDPNFALAHCYKSGFYSNQCVNALRIERRQSSPGITQNAGSTTAQSGIEPF